MVLWHSSLTILASGSGLLDNSGSESDSAAGDLDRDLERDRDLDTILDINGDLDLVGDWDFIGDLDLGLCEGDLGDPVCLL